ncbi:hypothetical protein Desaf_3007 [Desulfocurvibacter africanus subsp. africanus str. Walvis Bay]|uniref:Uncharacterized protein n=1 Tax=Desulfocurvibacter africanus subsp. africanus str. Walvis Bay TaxID=690850 RepID=F3Z2H5_DESAF|nr:hypothetical protein Desaf_3007 [Desulfocurvibacter africanus subsp. africanus str. Walvis Bay]
MRADELKELRQLKSHQQNPSGILRGLVIANFSQVEPSFVRGSKGENGHLKKLLAERNLKDEALKEIAARKW